MRRMNRNIIKSVTVRVRVRVMFRVRFRVRDKVRVRVRSLLLDIDFDGAHPQSTTIFCLRPSEAK